MASVVGVIRGWGDSRALPGRAQEEQLHVLLPPGSRVAAVCLCATEAVVVVEREEEKFTVLGCRRSCSKTWVDLRKPQSDDDSEDHPLTACIRLLPNRAVKLLCCNENENEMMVATFSDELFVFNQHLNIHQMKKVVLPAQGAVTKIAMGNSSTLFIQNRTAYMLQGADLQAAAVAVAVAIPEGEGVTLDVAAGFDFCVLCTTTGHTYSWGSGLYGRLGQHDTRDRARPTLLQDLEGIGNLAAGKGVTLVSASTWHAVAITAGPENTNEIWTWGWGRFGQFGGDVKDKMLTSPTRVDEWQGGDEETILQVETGPRHTAVLTAGGKVWVMGQLGPSDAQPPPPPRVLTDIDHVRHISSFRWGLLMV